MSESPGMAASIKTIVYYCITMIKLSILFPILYTEHITYILIWYTLDVSGVILITYLVVFDLDTEMQ